MAYQHITKHTSKNYTPASLVAGVFGQPRRITSVTIHHWGLAGQKFENVVNFLCTNNTPTSAHYVIEAGKVATLVAPDNAAWHTGNAAGNATSIGLELRPEAADGDYATAAELIRELRAVYGDLPLVPHKQWFNTACPGKWDLKRLDKLARTGTTAPASTSKPAPVKDWFAMASEADLRKIVKEEMVTQLRYNNTSRTKHDVYRLIVDAGLNATAARNIAASIEAQIKGLVGALKAAQSGETFDEAKLLAGVKAAAEAGVKNAVDSIETTTTVNIKEAK